MKWVKLFTVGTLLMLASVFTFADSEIVVRDAWVREAPPNASVLAAYLTLENTGLKADKLISVQCPDFEKIEIHATTIRDGVARMIALDTLPIPPHAVVTLAPGGQHLMLHHPRRALTAGAHVKMELQFSSGTRLTVAAPVRRAETGTTHNH